jgi:hypothetical protein
MRLTDHILNPIISPVLAWFGGGNQNDGLTPEERNAQNIYRIFYAITQKKVPPDNLQFTKKTEQTPMQTPAENQQLSQPAVRKGIEMQTDLRRQVARRRGMTRSILAGESNTGSASTLG